MRVIPGDARRLTTWPLLLWLISLLAFGLRAYGLGAESLWYDEAFSVVLARADLATALRMLSADVHPPLYYLALRAGIVFFGSGEFALRFVALIPGVLIVPLVWILARRLFDLPTATLASALAALSPLLIWYAREARMYSQATALGLAATYALVRAQDEGRARWWMAFAACAISAVYSHFSALYLVVALGLAWLANLKSPISNLRLAVAAFGAVAAGVVVAAPFLTGLAQSSQAYWPGQLDVASALVRTARAMIGGSQRIATPAWTDALVILCGVFVLAAMLHMVTTPSVRRGVWWALLILVCGMTLTFAVLYRRPKFEPRHLITLAPFVWLLIAVGVRAAWQVRSRLARVVVVAAVLVMASGLIIANADMLIGGASRDDWRGAVAFIQRNLALDETIVLVSGHAFPALAYYAAPRWETLPDDLSLDVTHILDYPSVAPILNRIQSRWRGVWLVLWQDEIVDPTQIVPALLGDVGTELPVEAQFTGLRLRHFVIDHPAEFPTDLPIAQRLNRSPLRGLTALGFTLSPQPLPADVPLNVRMFWRADAGVQGAAGGSLRILDDQGLEWARRDELLGGLLYSDRWPPNRWVMRQYTISLPLGAPPGDYQLRQVIYRGDESGSLDLGSVVVTRPLRSPDAAALGVASTGLARWNGLALLSVGLDQKDIKPCEPLYLTAVWRAESPLKDDYAVRVTLAGQAADQPIAPGLLTTQWRLGDVWRTRHHVTVPCRALDGPAQLQLTLLDSAGRPIAAPLSAGAVSIVANRVFIPPAMQYQFQVDLGGQMRLLGYDLKYPIPNTRTPIEVILYWQATREMTQSLTVFTHVQGDKLWGQHDGPPVAGVKPTDRWVMGEIVADRHVLQLDPATPPGQYRLVVGMYDPVSLVRVPAFDASGKRWRDDVIILQEIVVTR